MTQDEIIRMAREAGFVIWSDTSRKGMVDWACEYDTELERFAALVAAHEREALAEQAEHEPVAWIEIERGIPMFVRFADKYKPNCDGFIPLYAAPVRTKDLTDDEIEAIHGCPPAEWVRRFARAVIAAAIRVRGNK